MRSMAVGIVESGLQVSISLLGVGPAFCVGPLSERGLDNALCFSVGSRCVTSGAAVLDGHLLTGLTKLA